MISLRSDDRPFVDGPVEVWVSVAGPDIPRSGFPGADKVGSAPARGWLGAKPAATAPIDARKVLQKAGDRIQASTSVHFISDNRKIVAASELAAAERSTELGSVQSPQGNRE